MFDRVFEALLTALDIPSNDWIEPVAQRCSVNKVLLKISQNSQVNTCAGVSFLIKLQASACNFIRKGALAQLLSVQQLC